jgi:hypothetical protein
MIGNGRGHGLAWAIAALMEHTGVTGHEDPLRQVRFTASVEEPVLLSATNRMPLDTYRGAAAICRKRRACRPT